MRRPIALFLCFSASLAASGGAQALESLATYDRFSADTIDLSRWNESESVREVVRGKLRLAQRLRASDASDSGVTALNVATSVTAPSDVRQLAATITVTEVGNTDCAANTVGGWSGARIAGTFFNVGTRTEGSLVDDVLAQVRIRRAGDSTAADGVLEVQAVFVRCTDAACNASTTLKTIALGTTRVDTPTRVALRWDPARNRFLVSRDSQTAKAWAYRLADASPPGRAFKSLQVRNVVENCSTGERTGFVGALFDNVSVNSSAAP